MVRAIPRSTLRAHRRPRRRSLYCAIPECVWNVGRICEWPVAVPLCVMLAGGGKPTLTAGQMSLENSLADSQSQHGYGLRSCTTLSRCLLVLVSLVSPQIAVQPKKRLYPLPMSRLHPFRVFCCILDSMARCVNFAVRPLSDVLICSWSTL